MGEFRMPSLGADMTEGTLIEWLVRPGDAVHHGQVVAVIDTVKSAIDVEVFEDGEVERLLVEPGTTVQVGTPLALLRPVGALVETPATPSAGSAPRPRRKERTSISAGDEVPIPSLETTAVASAGSAPRPLRKERTIISSKDEGP
ncbi:MAG TPA: biotin/lipoyl-containing protein, partial [Candidatus Angelobacter sp.]|nr:biotin/lipoyl-containing protein [Candidatus Angelobacter sp.]